MKLQGTYQFTDRVAHDALVVTLDEMKAHLRIEQSFTEDDNYIQALILAAMDLVEQMTWRYLNQNTIQFNCEIWPDESIIYLCRGVAYQIESVKYIDSFGIQNTMSTGVDYNFDISNEIGRIKLLNRPELNKDILNAVEVIYTTRWNQFDTENIIPEAVKSAIKLMCGHWYENRQDVITGTITSELPKTSEYILTPYKIRIFA